MKKASPLFLAAPFFMVRIPFLTKQDFFYLVQKDVSLSHLSTDQQSLIQEAIAIASNSLYEAILDKRDRSPKDQIKIESSLLKYLLRMTSRCTPFGLFSFVSAGSWGNTLSASIDLNQVHKRARPDMEWLATLIEKICSSPEELPYLSVKKNPLVFYSGGRAHLNYFRKKNEEEKDRLLSIRFSFLTEIIFELAKNPIQIFELRNKVMEKFPFLDSEKVFKYIQQLITNQFLTYTLFPSLLTDSPFNEFLQKLSKIPSSVSLNEIKTKLEAFNQTPPGKGEKIFHELQTLMKLICPAKSYLQVDAAAYKGNTIVLPKQILNDFEEATELLWKLSSQSENFNSLRAYHNKFIEKYSCQRRVNLFELLNSDIGLGIPEGYLSFNIHSEMVTNSSKDNQWKKWLKREWEICIREKKLEIEISADLVERMIQSPNKEDALLSFELYCEINSISPEKLKNGNYLLQIVSLSWQGGNTFGRFLDILDNSVKNDLKAFLKEEESLERDSLFLTSSHFSLFPRLANVMAHPNLRDQALDLECSDSVDLNDIYVSADNERFYLTLKDSFQELNITNGSMLNPVYSPIALRFLQDVSRFKYQPLSAFSWGDLEENFFLPRIRFKKVILSPARWKVDLFQLSISGKESLEVIKEEFNKWCNQWELPRYLYLTENDNRILLDRNHPPHLNEIISKIKKGSEVKLVEKIGQESGEWVQSQHGTHFSEFVIPFKKNKKFSKSTEHVIQKKQIEIPTNTRWRMLGSEWIYLKCYLGIEGENRFLIENCIPFIEPYVQENIINGWFFVRYNDTKSHIRLRFRINEDKLQNFLSPLTQWSTSLVHHNLISDLAFGSYEREVERYGGVELITYAETIFCKNTLTAVHLIDNMKKKTFLSEDVIGALSIISMLKMLGLNLQEQILFFSSQALRTEELSGFRSNKEQLIFYGNAILNNTMHMYSEMMFFTQAMELQLNSLADFIARMKELKVRDELSTPAFTIFNNLIHMHCNRLLGRDSKKEAKVIIYAFHTLKILKNIMEAKSIEGKI